MKDNRDIIKTQLWHFLCEASADEGQDEDKLLDKYAELIALSIEHDCRDLYTAKDMLELINRSAINHYDGTGYWLDKDFNEVGYIFDGDTIPENVVWANWYNK